MVVVAAVVEGAMAMVETGAGIIIEMVVGQIDINMVETVRAHIEKFLFLCTRELWSESF